MNCRGLIGILSTAFWLAGPASPLLAQQPSEAHIQELIRHAAERAAAAQGGAPNPGQPSSGQTPPATARPVVRLTLDDSVRLALERNLDIAVQRLNPQITDISISSLQATYHPSLTSTVAQQAQTQAPLSQLQLGSGGGSVDANTTTYNAGISQSIPWGGGSFQLALNNSRQSTNSNNAFYNPQFQSVWSGVYLQPLFRGFRTDTTRQQLAVTKINRDISDVQLQSLIVNTLSNVRNAYWELVYSVQAVEVARQSLDLAAKLVEDNQTRVQIGTLAPIDVVQAQSEAATRRQALVAAESTRRTNELNLKKLIVNGTQDPNWNASLDPSDRPEFRPEAIDVESAVRRALSERTDMSIAKKSVDSNDETLKYLRDQLLPQADLQVNYGLQGVGGPYLQRSQSGVLGSSVTTIVPGGVADAFGTLFRNNYPRWTVQLNFSYPIGLSSQEAAVARARVQLNQVQAQVKQIELQVASEVTNNAISVQNAAESVQAAQAARELSQRKLEAEQSKFEVGMSTNYFVVQAQRDLSDAQNSELRAVLDYRKALVEFERVQQTTLQSANVTLLTAASSGGTPAQAAATAATSTGSTGAVTIGR